MKAIHGLHPLRRIVRCEKQNGRDVVVLICKHAVLGRPADPATARFYPCPECYRILVQYRLTHALTTS